MKLMEEIFEFNLQIRFSYQEEKDYFLSIKSQSILSSYFVEIRKNQWLQKPFNCLLMLLYATPLDGKSGTLSSMPLNKKKALLVNNI